MESLNHVLSFTLPLNLLRGASLLILAKMFGNNVMPSILPLYKQDYNHYSMNYAKSPVKKKS